MDLSPEERETHIWLSDADKGIAHVYSCQRRIMRKLSKLAKNPGVQLVESHKDEDGKLTGEEWDMPLELCRRLFAGKKRQMSKAHREAARQRMRAMRRAPVGAAR